MVNPAAIKGTRAADAAGNQQDSGSRKSHESDSTLEKGIRLSVRSGWLAEMKRIAACQPVCRPSCEGTDVRVSSGISFPATVWCTPSSVAKTWTSGDRIHD